MLCVVSAAILIYRPLLIQDKHLHEFAPPVNVTAPSFFNAFGTILYAFGGASVLPTIQVDMADPNKFPVAAVIGMTGKSRRYMTRNLYSISLCVL